MQSPFLPVRNFPLKTHHPVYLYNVDQTTAGWLLSDSDTLLSCAPSTRLLERVYVFGKEIWQSESQFYPKYGSLLKKVITFEANIKAYVR